MSAAENYPLSGYSEHLGAVGDGIAAFPPGVQMGELGDAIAVNMAAVPEGVVRQESPAVPMILGGIGLLGAIAHWPYVRGYLTHHYRRLRGLFAKDPNEAVDPPDIV